jgi:hypothetical protein
MNLSITGCVISVLFHEVAHVAMATTLRVRVKRMGFSWKGPYIVREPGTPAQNLCISLAGPAANAALMLVPGWFLINLALLIPNLLMKESDGRRAWNCWKVLKSSTSPAADLVVEGIMGNKSEDPKAGAG